MLGRLPLPRLEARAMAHFALAALLSALAPTRLRAKPEAVRGRAITTGA